MGKLKLTRTEIDKLVTVEQIDALPTVHGVGCNDVQFQTKIDGKIVWQYVLWRHILERCFSDKFKAKNPTYKDVTCCDEWLSFATFLECCNKEVGYSGKPQGYCLDKDLIIKGNKVYSPEACSFVPQAINKLLVGRGSERGEWPVGVCFHNLTGKFVVQLSVGGKQKTLGCYDKPEDAFSAYKVAKEAQIKVVAMQYKDVLKPAVFESLMNWSINVDD